MGNEPKSGWREWMQSDINEDAKRLGAWLRSKRTAIVLAVLWSVGIGTILIAEYYVLYTTTPVLQDPMYRPAFVPTLSSIPYPRLSGTDQLLILALGLLSGFLIYDVEATLFSSVASIILASLFGTTFATLFYWYTLDFRSTFEASAIPFVAWAGFLNIFRMIFPITILVTFLGGIFGCLIRDYIHPPR